MSDENTIVEAACAANCSSPSESPETAALWENECCSGRSWYQIAENLKLHARKLERERDESIERIGHAEILLSDLASGYWRSVMNEQDPAGEGIMGERVMQYWAQYSENEKFPSTQP